jgi:hypothetical protein
LTGRYLKLVTAADRNLTTSSWHFVTEPALDLDMGSAMAAGVAGLLPARLLQTKALLRPSSVSQLPLALR